MTTIARICERWTMHLEDSDEEWFQEWILRSPKQASHHLTAGLLAYRSLFGVYLPDAFESAWEPFGGIGAQALMIDELFSPAFHLVQDYSHDAVAHMRRALPRHITAVQADSYQPESHRPADLVGLDFGDLTVWKTRDGQPHRELLDRVFEAEPKAVVFTDIACRYLHLHRQRYESLLGPGTCRSYVDYLLALLLRLQVLYGYVLRAGYWDRWSAVMALVPSGTAPIGLLSPTPDSPVGLEIL